MYRKVKDYIEKNQMILTGDGVTAGVSGGGDSMALLFFLWELQKEKAFSLTAVHVNHGIRGDEALRDQKLVEEFCARLGIPCQVNCYDVPGIAGKNGLGEEEAGRMVRREALLKASGTFRRQGRRVRIALAHNQNDLAETMLHHLARGTGLRGLGGMDAVSGEIIRPFLCLERKEIDDYLKEKKIPYVLDSTNLKDTYTRNRIRHHVLPVLEQEVNSRAVAHLAEVSLLLRQADEYLAEEAERLLREYLRPDGSYFLKEDFFCQKEILKSYEVLQALAALAGKRKDLSSVHVLQVLGLYEKQSGRRISLPGGVIARRCVSGVILEKESPEEKGQGGRGGFSNAVCGNLIQGKTEENREEEPGEWILRVPGQIRCPLGSFSARIFSYEGQKILEKKYTKWLDYDKINENIVVRTRKEGDYLVIDQEGNRKKLKKFLIDEKVPSHLRNRLALAACGSEILWIVGGRMSAKYKISSRTRTVLELCFEEPPVDGVQESISES